MRWRRESLEDEVVEEGNGKGTIHYSSPFDNFPLYANISIDAILSSEDDLQKVKKRPFHWNKLVNQEEMR